jgi:sterol desaturase/sphingolipid hydroxylase (fatty acid hydroxylase superfamily)
MTPEQLAELQQVIVSVLTPLLRPIFAFLRHDTLIFCPFLLSALVLSLAVFAFQHRRLDRTFLRDYRRTYFTRAVWAHRSAVADYKFYLVNTVIFPFVFAPAIVSGAWISRRVDAGLDGVFGDVAPWADPFWPALTYTILFFVLYDLGRWIAHYVQHRFPILWEFHKVHHSAEVLTPFTNYRAHPVDLLCMATVPAILTGAGAGVVVHAFGTDTAYPTFYGLHLFVFVYNLIGNLRHSHVWLSYGPVLSRVFISPAQHQIHHSTEARHFGRNIGYALAVWDRLFGTLYVPKGPEAFAMGLGDGSEPTFHGVRNMYLRPFANLMAPRDHRPDSPAA